MSLVKLVALALVGVLTCNSPAVAQSYPTKPLRLIVPFPAGGTSDILGRLMAQRLGDALGQTVFVENRTGAGGVIGTEAVARSTPDGYTLLIGNFGPIAVAPGLYKSIKYDTLRDLEPVSLIAKTPNVILVKPDHPAKNLKEFLAYAKERPETLSYASAGIGTSNHIGTERLKQMTGISMTHVPYRGSAPAVSDLMAGQVAMTMDPLTACLPLIKAGKLRALAVGSTQRASALPDVPTAAEAGLPGFENGTWNGILVAAGTPGPIVERLSDEIRKILNEPALRTQIETGGSIPAPMTPGEYRRFIAQEISKWGEVIKASNIRADE